MKKLNRFFFVSFLFLFLFMTSSLFVSAYFSSSFGFSGLSQTSNTKNLCGTGPDFIVQVAPFGCVPVPVRSDALSQENFPVYCKLIATKISPLVTIKEIRGISISGNGKLNKEIEGIGFHPSRSALGVDEKIEHPIGNDIGYAVIVLKKQPNESALPSVVQGNFSLNLHYDVQNAFGISNSNLYLPVVSSNIWKSEPERFSFWNGKGYLRARVVTPNEATIDVYSPSQFPSGEKTRIFSTTLKEGSLSKDISMPGFLSCNAHLNLRLDKIQAPGTTALIEVNGADYQVEEGESFLNGACYLNKISKSGLEREVQGECHTDDGLKNFDLKISPKITLKIDGILKEVSVGDLLYENKVKGNSVYLGYAGNYNNGISNNPYIVLFEKPGLEKKMTPYELYFETAYVEGVFNSVKQTNSLSGTTTKIGTFFGGLLGELTSNFVGGYKTSLPIFQNKAGGKNILESMKILKFPASVLVGSIDSGRVKFIGISGPTNVKLESGVEGDYKASLQDYGRALEYPDKSYPLNSKISLAETAGIEKINLSYNLNQKGDVLKFCNDFKSNFPGFSEKPDISPEYKRILGFCSRSLDLSSSSISKNYFVIGGSSNELSLLNTYEPSLADYSVKITVSRAKNYRNIEVDSSNQPVPLAGSDVLKITNPNKYNRISFEIKNKTDSRSYSIEVGKTKTVKFGARSYIVGGHLGTISNYLTVEVPYNTAQFLGGTLGKGSRFYLSGGDYITLEKLTPTFAYFDTTNVQKDRAFLQENTLKVKLNGEGLFGSLGYKLFLNKINLKEVAKVSVVSNIKNTGTSTNVSFKIPIEKRAIQLTPEKIKSQIKTLNKTLKEFASLEKTTGKLVSGFKSACIATQAALMAKNFFSDMGGKGIARQAVMKGNNGWYTKCTGQIPEVYSTMEECLLKNSANIDKDVASYYNQLSVQNGQIKSLENNYISSKTFLGRKIISPGFKIAYAKSVQKELLSNLGNVFSATFPFLTRENKINITAQINYLSSKNSMATIDEIRSLLLNSRIALNTGGADSNSILFSQAKANLIKTLNSIYIENEGTLKVDSLQEELGGVPIVSCNDGLKENKRTIFTSGTTTFSNLKTGIKPPFSEDDPIQVCLSRGGGIQVLDLKKGSSSVPYMVLGTYTLKKSGTGWILNGYKPTDNNPLGIVVKKVDESSYNNPYKGSVENPGKGPVLTYYESGVNKGLPAIVPFDSVHGWYASVDNSLGSIKSYDASGKVNNFYLCNVGSNGLEQNKKPDDICEGIDLGTNFQQDKFPGLSSEDASRLIHKAVSAIEYASKLRQRHNGPLTGYQIIVADGTSTKVYVGKPAVQSSNVQCQDFMSPSDCNLLFNVCDPVVCPSSRCDLGGAYHVPNVIQSGIIGSIALCLPNAKEGIAVPVCLSGINAGLQGFQSVLSSYRSCLQENLKTGKTVGICDEIYSVYLCQMFWKQALPLTNIAIPSILSATTDSAKGGGEYFGATNSWDQVKKSMDYFTQKYAASSFRAFKFRNEQETGATVCKNFGSVVYPTSVSSLKSFVKPDSPVQFSGGFSEVASQTVTNPPESQYKVYYHIFAGKDSQAFYMVYLKGDFNGGSYYNIPSTRIINRSYIARGQSADVTDNFLAPSGYKQLCISVNGQEKCGFKLVSTSFAINEIKNEYLKQEATQKNIKSEKQCISGTASAYNLLNLNVQNGVQNTINPKIYNQGIRRICASKNPGEGTDRNLGTKNQRWVNVGYCANENIKCWQDQESVANVISDSNIKKSALGDQSARVLKALENGGKGMTHENFTTEINNIKKTNPQEQISSITEDLKRVIEEYQKGELYLLRANVYGFLAKEAYKVQEISNRLRIEAIKKAESKGGPSGNQKLETSSSRKNSMGVSSGLQIKRNYKIKLSANYYSPVFEFHEGSVVSNLYYAYNLNDGWKWSQNELSALSSWWKLVKDFKGGNSIPFNTLTSKEGSLIESLKDSQYRTGLGIFVSKVKSGKSSGFFSFLSSQPILTAKKNSVVVTYSHNGLFEVQQSSATPLWFEYENKEWWWTPYAPKNGLINGIPVSTTTVPKPSLALPGKYDGQKPVPANVNLIKDLNGLNLTEGAIVLFNGGMEGLTKEIVSLNINKNVETSSPKKVTSKNPLSSSQLVIGKKILEIVKKVQSENSRKFFLKDSVVKEQTGAKNFGCLVLQIAMQESGLEHCVTENRRKSEPLYCDGNINSVIESSDDSSYGVLQINRNAHPNVAVSDFTQNVEGGVNYLINSYDSSPASQSYKGNYKKYQKAEWNSSLRAYNGWGVGSSADMKYVSEVLGRKEIISEGFSESCGNGNSKSNVEKNVQRSSNQLKNGGTSAVQKYRIKLSTNYYSPVFEFEDGTITQNSYYSYNVKEDWRRYLEYISINSPKWVLVNPLKSSGGNNGRDNLNWRLSRVKYRLGLEIFINKVNTGKSSGFFSFLSSQPTLTAKKKGVVVTYSHNGLFEVQQPSVTPLWFEYENNEWWWTPYAPKNGLINGIPVSTTTVPKPSLAPRGKFDGQTPISVNKNIINDLNGLNLTEGSVVLFNGGLDGLQKLGVS